MSKSSSSTGVQKDLVNEQVEAEVEVEVQGLQYTRFRNAGCTEKRMVKSSGNLYARRQLAIYREVTFVNVTSVAENTE